MQNITAMTAHRHLFNTNLDLTRSVERLSSGYRINRAADDAAGLAISERMRTQVRGIDQGRRNIQDAISMLQTGEAGMVEIGDMLQRMRQLAVQASNATLTASDRRMIQAEVNQLVNEIDRLASTTVFNTMQLLKGQAVLAQEGTNMTTFHVGANENEIIKVVLPARVVNTATVREIGSKTLGGAASGKDIYSFMYSSNLETGGIMTRERAESAITIVNEAINQISVARADLGAYQNRLEHTLNAAGIAMENQAASESRIRDLDVASETTIMTRNRILVQAGTAMLAQANTLPQNVLALIR
jgi:flagellin